MDPNHKKTALRMIPYGIYVLTAEADGQTAAATVNWVTQTSFDPPLVAVAVKADSGARAAVEAAGSFALNILGKGQQGTAFGFFKTVERDGDMLGKEKIRAGHSGHPVLESAPACVECRVEEIVSRGDHHIVIAEVIHAHLPQAPEGRADDATLHMRDLGDNVFYGG
ncbi:MAG: flavin reductase family protein [Alphaproteobacteria bacterium]|nr:flavin reductase family protein [Alphaproteobacteria bacterium]MCB9929728.1 flavin reductase family protein [Alphaproteobacteria bacterium]